jgi:hypothetical protein
VGADLGWRLGPAPFWIGPHLSGRYVPIKQRIGTLPGVEFGWLPSDIVSVSLFADVAIWFVGSGYVGGRFGPKLRVLLAREAGFGVWAGLAFEAYPGQSSYAPWIAEGLGGFSFDLGGAR